MKAAPNTTTALRYCQYDWGDHIEGTKDQLQALGLGVDLKFPGEPGGPKRQLTTKDPRGYKVTIGNRFAPEGLFAARLYFPGWPEHREFVWEEHPTLKGIKIRAHTWFDDYRGTAEDLAAAGLVCIHHLPGAAGLRKTRVSFRADGTVVGGPPTANRRDRDYRWIVRVSPSHFEVTVVLPEDEKLRREAARKAATHEWERAVRALPRPMRLDVWSIRNTQAPQQRNHLRLVWSAA